MHDFLGRLDDAYAGFRFPSLNHGYRYPLCSRLHLFRDESDWALVVEIVAYSEINCSIEDIVHRYASFLPAELWGAIDDDYLDRVADVPDLMELEREQGAVTDPEVTVMGRERRIPGSYTVLDLARHLGDTAREELLATPEEIRAWMPRPIPELLVLDDWYHDDSRKPSEYETFAMLGRVIESGDPDAYAPTQPGNTHWRNWPDAGSL